MRLQAYVFAHAARPAVDSILHGFNASVIAYGPTGAGKTFTMEGSPTALDEDGEEAADWEVEGEKGWRGWKGPRVSEGEGEGESEVTWGGAGIIPRCVSHVFTHIGGGLFPVPTTFLVRAAYLQIYNESISDLLRPERSNLSIRETGKRGLFVEGLSEWVVRSPEEVGGLLERGAAARTTAATRANELSSRSHAVFLLIVEQSQPVGERGGEGEGDAEGEQGQWRGAEGAGRRFTVAKLNLVDLAGSERARTSGASGVRLAECKAINSSLSALGNVIYALTDAKGRAHVPYRDSKLTRLLQVSRLPRIPSLHSSLLVPIPSPNSLS